MLIPPNLDLHRNQIWEAKDTPTGNSTQTWTHRIKPLHLHRPNLFCLLNSGSQRHKQPAESNLREPLCTSSAIPHISSGTTIRTPAPGAVITYTLSALQCLGSGPGLFSWILHWSHHLTSLPPAWTASIPLSWPLSRDLSPKASLCAYTAFTRESTRKWTRRNDLRKCGFDCLLKLPLFSPTTPSQTPGNTRLPLTLHTCSTGLSFFPQVFACLTYSYWPFTVQLRGHLFKGSSLDTRHWVNHSHSCHSICRLLPTNFSLDSFPLAFPVPSTTCGT